MLTRNEPDGGDGAISCVSCLSKLWHNRLLWTRTPQSRPRYFPHSSNALRKRISLRSASPHRAPTSPTSRRAYRLCTKRRRSGGHRIGAEVAELLDFKELWRSLDHDAITHHVDCDTAVYDFAPPPHRPGARQPQELSPSGTFVPILFLPWDKPDLSDSLLVCFGALALSQATGVLADTGTLIYGEGYRRKTVRIGDHVVRTRQTIDAIAATCHSRKPPPLVLNRHCAVCDFQPRCRGLAIERDDLSLLSAMTGKERAKCNAKGIFSITQLSYGYRPRRRKRNRPDAESSKKSGKRAAPIVRNDHKLKALAVKKNQIHVVGAPSLKFDGIPTFLDVEGMPDRDFYYLVGLRFESRRRTRGALVLGRWIGWRARNMGELPAGTQGDRQCADRQLRRVRDPVSQADEGALHSGA